MPLPDQYPIMETSPQSVVSTHIPTTLQVYSQYPCFVAPTPVDPKAVPITAPAPNPLSSDLDLPVAARKGKIHFYLASDIQLCVI